MSRIACALGSGAPAGEGEEEAEPAVVRVLGDRPFEHAHRVGVAAHVAQRAAEAEQRLLAQRIGKAELQRLLVAGDRLGLAAGSVVCECLFDGLAGRIGHARMKTQVVSRRRG